MPLHVREGINAHLRPDGRRPKLQQDLIRHGHSQQIAKRIVNRLAEVALEFGMELRGMCDLLPEERGAALLRLLRRQRHEQEVLHPHPQRAAPPFRVMHRRRKRGHRCAEVAEEPLRDHAIQVLLRTEVAVHKRHVHARPRADAPRRGGLVSARRKLGLRRLDDGISRGLPV